MTITHTQLTYNYFDAASSLGGLLYTVLVVFGFLFEPLARHKFSAKMAMGLFRSTVGEGIEKHHTKPTKLIVNGRDSCLASIPGGICKFRASHEQKFVKKTRRLVE